MTARLPWNERHGLIVDAASRLFATRGYEHTTIEDVAAAAGVTKPIVYRHFGAKKELHLALLALHRDRLLATLANAMQGEAPLPARVRAAAAAWLAYVEDQPYAGKMLFRDTTGEPEVREFHDGMQATARSAIGALIAAEPDSAVPTHLLEPLSELVRAALAGLAIWWTDHRDARREDLIDASFAAIWLGLDRARLASAWR